MGGQLLLNELLRATRSRDTGVVEWKDDRRRRLFYFDAGELVLIQSNLKSESAERVAERFAGLSTPELRRRIIEWRFRGGIGELAGTVQFQRGVEAPQREPAPIGALLYASVEGLPLAPPVWFPHAVDRELIELLPAEPEVIAYLQALDGGRAAEDIRDFGPAAPEVLDRLMRIALAIGGLEDTGHEAVVTTVTREASRSPSSGQGDIANLIAQEVGTPIGVDPMVARFGPLMDRIPRASDHYAVLGVRWDDPPDVMRKAYFALARDLHPDRFVGDPEDTQRTASDLFDRVRAAWEVLGDDEAREAYARRVIHGEKSEEEKAADKVRDILSAESEFKRGVQELTAGRIAAAHELFKGAVALVPEEKEFVAYLAYTELRVTNGKDESAASDALERLKSVVESTEKLDNAWVLYGQALRLRGNDAGARKAFVRALQIKPANPDAERELKRMTAARQEQKEEAKGGFFSRWFGKK